MHALAEKMKRVCNISLSRSDDSEGFVNGSASAATLSTQENVWNCDDDDADDDTSTPSPWPLPAPEEGGQLELPTDPQCEFSEDLGI